MKSFLGQEWVPRHYHNATAANKNQNKQPRLAGCSQYLQSCLGVLPQHGAAGTVPEAEVLRLLLQRLSDPRSFCLLKGEISCLSAKPLLKIAGSFLYLHLLSVRVQPLGWATSGAGLFRQTFPFQVRIL